LWCRQFSVLGEKRTKNKRAETTAGYLQSEKKNEQKGEKKVK